MEATVPSSSRETVYSVGRAAGLNGREFRYIIALESGFSVFRSILLPNKGRKGDQSTLSSSQQPCWYYQNIGQHLQPSSPRCPGNHALPAPIPGTKELEVASCRAMGQPGCPSSSPGQEETGYGRGLGMVTASGMESSAEDRKEWSEGRKGGAVGKKQTCRLKWE